MPDRISEDSPPDALGPTIAGAFDDEIVAAFSAPGRPDGTASYFDRDPFEALGIFRGILLEHRRFESLLQGLCEQVAAAIPGADMAGVTLLHHDSDNPATAAYSDARVVDIDTDQYLADEGPCLEAARTERIMCGRVDEAAVRWPRFASAAAEIGVRSYLSAPLAVDSGHAGSLNVYGFDAHGFSDIDEVLVTMFVTAVEAAVWNSRHTAQAKEEITGLRAAMVTRGTIEQAKGILIAVHGLSPEAAFAALAEQSQRENIRVAVLAARIVDSVVADRRQVGSTTDLSVRDVGRTVPRGGDRV